MMSVATCIPDSVSLCLSCLSEKDWTVVENVLTVYNHAGNDGLISCAWRYHLFLVMIFFV